MKMHWILYSPYDQEKDVLFIWFTNKVSNISSITYEDNLFLLIFIYTEHNYFGIDPVFFTVQVKSLILGNFIFYIDI